MKKIILLLSTALIISLNVSAQEGKPSMKIFSNFNYDMSAEEDENAFKEFELKRAYLGYGYTIDERFSTKITFDVGSNSSGSAYTAFLKIASLKWKATDNLSVNFGMLGTKNFKFMEKKNLTSKSSQTSINILKLVHDYLRTYNDSQQFTHQVIDIRLVRLTCHPTSHRQLANKLEIQHSYSKYTYHKPSRYKKYLNHPCDFLAKN